MFAPHDFRAAWGRLSSQAKVYYTELRETKQALSKKSPGFFKGALAEKTALFWAPASVVCGSSSTVQGSADGYSIPRSVGEE